MEKCKRCIHEEACQAWIRHGDLLYNDFSFSVENCPYFACHCKDCEYYVLHALACRHENFNGVINMNGFCSYGKPRDN